MKFNTVLGSLSVVAAIVGCAQSSPSISSQQRSSLDSTLLEGSDNSAYTCVQECEEGSTGEDEMGPWVCELSSCADVGGFDANLTLLDKTRKRAVKIHPAVEEPPAQDKCSLPPYCYNSVPLGPAGSNVCENYRSWPTNRRIDHDYVGTCFAWAEKLNSCLASVVQLERRRCPGAAAHRTRLERSQKACEDCADFFDDLNRAAAAQGLD